MNRMTHICLIVIAVVSCTVDNRVFERQDGAYKIPVQLNGSLQNPAWSPDGDSLVFTRFRNGYNEGPADLYIVDPDTGDTTPLVSEGSENVNLPGSVWNGTTGNVVFSSSRGDSNPDLDHDEIYCIAASGSPGDEVKLTERSGVQAYEPSYSPDGGYIVFESHMVDDEFNGSIVKKDLSQPPGSGYVDLTSTGDCRQPNWSPQGDRIVFQQFEDNTWDLYVMNSDGSGVVKVTGGSGDNTDASFSPDGSTLVYSSDNASLEFANIFTVPVSGGTPVRITRYDGYDGAPAWSPDGTKVAFESYPGDPDGTAGTTLWIIDIQ